MDITVIIPAYNEEEFICETINSIQDSMPSKYSFEIIVVDHGSTDDTAIIASSLGALVIDGKQALTIASLRNLGVANSSGEILFFIDADVTFTAQWAENIGKVIESLRVNSSQICGSLPKIPRNSSKLMKLWFDPKSNYKNPKYIGSCHLITSKEMFDKVGGFPATLETGEDFNFCMTAVRLGAKIVAYPELSVVHNGSPSSLIKFAEREVWHGRGDWTNLNTLFSSKVALLTLVFLTAHCTLFIALMGSFEISGILPEILVIIVMLCLVSSIVKFSSSGLKVVAVNSFTFYIYYMARTLSLFSSVLSKSYQKRERAK